MFKFDYFWFRKGSDGGFEHLGLPVGEIKL